MEDIFLKYMNERLKFEKKKPSEKGPIITISREYGCYASEIAELLVDKINSTGVDTEWNHISHEILNKVARSLSVSTKEISHIFGANKQGIFAELLKSFNTLRPAVTDESVITNISRVVTNYSNLGNFVIVGRAGCVLAKHIKRSVHIRLNAPMEWRIAHIAQRFNLSTADAIKDIREKDQQRAVFMKFFKGDRPHSELFDMELNRATLSNKEIVDSIFSLAAQRNVIISVKSLHLT